MYRAIKWFLLLWTLLALGSCIIGAGGQYPREITSGVGFLGERARSRLGLGYFVEEARNYGPGPAIVYKPLLSGEFVAIVVFIIWAVIVVPIGVLAMVFRKKTE